MKQSSASRRQSLCYHILCFVDCPLCSRGQGGCSQPQTKRPTEAIELLNGDLETRRPSSSFPTVLCRSELAHHFFLFEKRNRARQRLFNLHMCDCVIVCSCSCFRHAWVTRARPCLSARIVPGTTGNTSTHLILPAPT